MCLLRQLEQAVWCLQRSGSKLGALGAVAEEAMKRPQLRRRSRELLGYELLVRGADCRNEKSRMICRGSSTLGGRGGSRCYLITIFGRVSLGIVLHAAGHTMSKMQRACFMLYRMSASYYVKSRTA